MHMEIFTLESGPMTKNMVRYNCSTVNMSSLTLCFFSNVAGKGKYTYSGTQLNKAICHF